MSKSWWRIVPYSYVPHQSERRKVTDLYYFSKKNCKYFSGFYSVFVCTTKVSFSYLWQLLTFSFGVISNFSQQKSPTAKIIGLYFLGTNVPRKYMPTISAVGLFCCNKFEETPNEKVSNCQSKLKLTLAKYAYVTVAVNIWKFKWHFCDIWFDFLQFCTSHHFFLL